MNSVKNYWNGNADTWTKLSRAGYDTYRDYLNTPAFMKMLPEVNGLSGLDIGCGEGSNTRQLATLGADMTAFDISHIFIHHANTYPELTTIHYLTANAELMPFKDGFFDFAVGFMSFMDIANLQAVIKEVFRVLKPGGFLQFSISHPFMDTPYHKNLRGEDGLTYAYEVAGYFHNMHGDISEWIFSAAPPEVKQSFSKFKVPRHTHTISQWLNMLLEQGFVLERLEEPYPDDETVRQCPNIQDAQVIAYFLHVRVRKPRG